MTHIPLGDGRFVPLSEIDFATARSGGPGGQNVNKVETRVIVRFNVAASPTLTDEERRQILARLSTRIDRRGVLRVSSQKHRTQGQNRATAVERLGELLREAMIVEKPRRPRGVSAAARAKRLREKKERAEKKRRRESGRRVRAYED